MEATVVPSALVAVALVVDSSVVVVVTSLVVTASVVAVVVAFSVVYSFKTWVAGLVVEVSDFLPQAANESSIANVAVTAITFLNITCPSFGTIGMICGRAYKSIYNHLQKIEKSLSFFQILKVRIMLLL